MAKSLSLTELAALYANKGKNPKALFEQETKTPLNTVLPGVSTADKLNKLFFTRQNGLLPVRPKAWASETEHNTIAICVVIVDSLHHEDIWRQWIEQSDSPREYTEGSVRYKAELFIHAKHPEMITSEWVKARLIDVTFRPEWNSVEVVQSLLSVLDAALQYTSKDASARTLSAQDTNTTHNTPHDARNAASTSSGACGRFLLATESCLPLYDLQTTAEILFKEESSWLNAYHTPQGSWEAGTCFRAVDADVVPPKAVWKSLPGWILLTRLHALEVVTLSAMLGGWGQAHEKDSSSANSNMYSNMCDPVYVNSYQGTKAENWRVCTGAVPEATTTTDSTSTDVTTTATTTTITEPTTTSTITTITTATTTPISTTTTQPALLSAWGAGGSWHEHNGSVFAPEEIFFPTVLSLLGYLRDPSSSGGASDSNGVRIATVTFAEWQKRGDANPIQHDYFDAHIVTRMRASGATFGRKFSRGSVSAEEWSRVVKQIDRGGGGGGGSTGRYNNQYNNQYNNHYNNRSDNRYGDGYGGSGEFNNQYNNNYRDNNNHYNNSNREYNRYDRHNNSRNYHSNNSGDNRYDSRDSGRDGGSDSKRRKY